MSNGVCEACGGCGELCDPLGGMFRCPDCGGTRRLNGDESEQAASVSGAVSLAIPREVWGRVVEAGRLNGRKPLAWAVDALDNAARHQVHKASKKRTARSRSSVKRRVPLECKSGERRSQRPERTDVLDRPASRERSRRNND